MAKTKEAPVMEEPTEEQVKMSQEELTKRRTEITNYYKDNIKHLKIQLEYETLLKDIEETRAQRVQHQMFLAQAMAPPPEGDPSGSSQAAMDFMAAQQEAEAEGGKEFAEKTQGRTLKRTQ